MMFLATFIASFIFFNLFFVIAQLKKNNGLADMAWGLGFIVVAVTSLVYQKTYELHQLIITLLVVMWGLRLFYHIGLRNWKAQEDFRYVNMRQKWGKHVHLKAYVIVFMLQMSFMYIVSLPIQIANFYTINQDITSFILIGLGVMLWVFGFYFEARGDHELKEFKKDPTNKGKILTSGLWKYTRHPNYFGEAVMWWGIWIISLSTLSWFAVIGIISPLFMNYLLRYVSGVPLLEKRYANNDAFQEYAKQTSIFIPKRPKKQ